MSREKESMQLMFGVFLCVLSVLIAWNAYQFSIPLISKGTATWLDAPGVAPILSSIVLFVLSLRVIVSSLRNGAGLGVLVKKAIPEAMGDEEAKTVAIVFGTLIAYQLAFPRVPYLISTTAFLLALFYILRVLNLRIGFLAFLVSGSLFIVFRIFFRISLP